MFACRPQTESRVSAVCVCPQINVCAHSNRQCSVDFFFVCVYTSTVWTCTQEKYPVSLHLCLGRGAWVTAWRGLLNRGYEWVPPPAKSCQSNGERVHRSIQTGSCYKWGGHLHRKTDWATDGQQSDTQTETGERRTKKTEMRNQDWCR